VAKKIYSFTPHAHKKAHAAVQVTKPKAKRLPSVHNPETLALLRVVRWGRSSIVDRL